MPIYEYQCGACGHQLEAFQKFSDEALKDCPECHKAELQKLISSSAFHLKGGGWYVTDIRDKDKKKPAAESDTTASSSTTTTTDAAVSAPSSPADKKTSEGSSSSSGSTDSSAG